MLFIKKMAEETSLWNRLSRRQTAVVMFACVCPKIRFIIIEPLSKLVDLVLKNNFLEFNASYFQQLRGTAIGTKCAPSYAILFLAALEERLLEEAQYKPFLWWHFIDDIFLVWLHGEEKLSEFINFLNGAHHSLKFTAEWSKEKINFLDVQVIREGTKLMTDLYSKPTDTHQLLHRT